LGFFFFFPFPLLLVFELLRCVGLSLPGGGRLVTRTVPVNCHQLFSLQNIRRDPTTRAASGRTAVPAGAAAAPPGRVALTPGCQIGYVHHTGWHDRCGCPYALLRLSHSRGVRGLRGSHGLCGGRIGVLTTVRVDGRVPFLPPLHSWRSRRRRRRGLRRRTRRCWRATRRAPADDARWPPSRVVCCALF
jgi:hypothetical protein